MKKKTTSKRSVFQDPRFIRSLCEVVGALGFSCITLFTYAQNHPVDPQFSRAPPLDRRDSLLIWKSDLGKVGVATYFILNPLKLDHFIFSTKILCQMFFKLV